MDSFESVVRAAARGILTESGATLQSLQTKLSVEHLSQSGGRLGYSPGDRASKSIVKARGQDNIFSALESEQV